MSGTEGSRDPHQRVRELLGVHALGHLGPGEEAAVRAHLDGCADCRAELAEIAPLRESLDGVDPERLSSPASPPPWLGERVRRSVAAERAARGQEQAPVQSAVQSAGQSAGQSTGRPVVTLARRRTPLLAAAAAAVLVVGLGGALVGRATAPTAPPPAVPFEAVVLQVVGEEQVSISRAGLVPHTWGVELRFTGAGFERGAVYRATFVDDRGRTTPAGEFLGTGADEMVCNLQSALLRPRAEQVVITDDAGRTVLTADI